MGSRTAIGVALALALASSGTGAKMASPPPPGMTIAAAVAAPDRSADNIKRDESRKPGDVLNFLGVKPGMRVADMFGGNHYWAEIFSGAVGPKGKVVSWVPTQFTDDKSKAKYAAFTAARPNVSFLISPFEAPKLPAKAFDLMLINLDYHDVYWTSAKEKVVTMDPNAWLKVIYASMKPGGVVGVIDHIANPGDTRATVDKLHRIDPATVRADFERAGFIFDGDRAIFRNAADDHSLLVFDPAIRGKTDRFFFRFKKPG